MNDGKGLIRQRTQLKARVQMILNEAGNHQQKSVLQAYCTELEDILPQYMKIYGQILRVTPSTEFQEHDDDFVAFDSLHTEAMMRVYDRLSQPTEFTPNFVPEQAQPEVIPEISKQNNAIFLDSPIELVLENTKKCESAIPQPQCVDVPVIDCPVQFTATCILRKPEPLNIFGKSVQLEVTEPTRLLGNHRPAVFTVLTAQMKTSRLPSKAVVTKKQKVPPDLNETTPTLRPSVNPNRAEPIKRDVPCHQPELIQLWNLLQRRTDPPDKLGSSCSSSITHTFIQTFTHTSHFFCAREYVRASEREL